MSKMAVKELEAFGACWWRSLREGLAALLGMRWDGACIISVGRNGDPGIWSLGSLTLLLLLLVEL